jgi:hypothetical protein
MTEFLLDLAVPLLPITAAGPLEATGFFLHETIRLFHEAIFPFPRTQLSLLIMRLPVPMVHFSPHDAE